MPLKSLLFSFHLRENQNVETILGELDQILCQKLILELDQKHPLIRIKENDFIQLFSSTKEDISITIRYYSATRLISIDGEMLHTCTKFNSPMFVEKIKEELNALLIDKNDTNQAKRDLVEAVPSLKRNNQVPLYFLTSDGRVLEYDFIETLVNEDSAFQNIKILRSPTLGNCLLLDDMQNLAEADLPYTHGLMNYGINSYRDKDILILGGGDGGLLNELLKESPKYVTMVEIDHKVMNYCQKYLRGACGTVLDSFVGPKSEIIVGDCLKYMQLFIEQGRMFDVIFNDLTDIPISTKEQKDGMAQDNTKLWIFIKEILNLSMKLLKDGGLYMNHAIGINCKQSLSEYEQVLDSFSMVKYSRHSRYVPSFMEDWIFYQIEKNKI